MIIAFKLAEKGYYSGDPDKVLSAPVDRVLRLSEYIAFQSEYAYADFKMDET